MSEATAAETLEFLARDAREQARTSLHVSMYGGEPMLHPDRLHQLMDGLLELQEQLQIPVVVLFYTNGTIVRPDVLAKLKRFDDYDVQVSLDGTKEEHDRNRNGSWDRVVSNLERLDELSIPRAAHPVVSAPYRFVETYENLAEQGFGFVWMQTFEYPVYRSSESLRVDVEVWSREYRAFCDHYLDALERGERVFVMPLLASLSHLLAIKRPGVGRCRARGDYIGVTPDGRIHPCVIAAGLGRFAVGQVKNGVERGKLADFAGYVEQRARLRDECERCSIRRYCQGSCLGNCFHEGGVSDELCRMLEEKLKIEVAFVFDLVRRLPDLGERMLRGERPF